MKLSAKPATPICPGDSAQQAQQRAWRAGVRRGFLMLSGRWKLEILCCLNARTHRFGELRRALPGITQHVLATQLRDMEADGLITRTAYLELVPRVEYALTAKAHELRPILEAMWDWVDRSSDNDSRPAEADNKVRLTHSGS